MADADILTTLQKEWAKKETDAEVESLGGLPVKVSPLTWDDKQQLFKDGEKAWPKLALKRIMQADGKPLFSHQDELKRPRNVERILVNEVDPKILQELISLLLPQLEVEDVDKGKQFSEEKPEST
jgi:membrane peptidoglycan carboxypeptidase